MRRIDAVYETSLPLPGRRRGKVRDVYDLPGGYSPVPDAGPGVRVAAVPALLIVASDRVSAFDVVMPTPIPGKGRLLTDIASRWFEFIEQRGLAATHVLSTSAHDIPGLNAAQRDMLAGRVTIARKCRVVPIECVVRGYLAGSGWADYQRTRAVCGVALPPGMQRGERIRIALGDGPIFTPATKAAEGHDENISYDHACDLVGEHVMRRLREMSIRIYLAAHDYARERGVILADTKFEFGVPVDDAGEPDSDQLILIDEALTPDSSRYWPAENYTPGREQQSFDKQPLRDYLEGLVARGEWSKSPPGPALPPDVVSATIDRYREARRRLFGEQ